MRERNAGTGGRSERRSDPRHDEAGDALRGEHLELLPSAAEHKGIAALQARDTLARPCQLDQQLVDARLMCVLARLLTDKNPLRIAARSLEYGIRHQAVVEDDVGLLQQLQRPQRQQVRVTRAGSDQVYLAEGTAADCLRDAKLRVQELACEGLACR